LCCRLLLLHRLQPHRRSPRNPPNLLHSNLLLSSLLLSSPPLRSPVLLDEATDLLAEADHIFDQELMRISADPGPSVRRVLDKARASLRRAHEVVDSKPGTAASLARQVLIDLDQLESARQSAVGTG